MKALLFSILCSSALSLVVQTSHSHENQLSVANDPDCKFEDTVTLSFDKLREYLRDPRFLICSEKQDTEDRRNQGVKQEQAVLAGTSNSSHQSQIDESIINETNIVRTLETLKQDLEHLDIELPVCFDQRILNVEKYYRVRQKIFAVEQELSDFQANSDEKAQARKALENVLIQVNVMEKIARKDCEQDHTNYCMFFAPESFSKAIQFVVNKMSFLRAQVLDAEVGSPILGEYLETFRKLERNLVTLQNTDMRYLKDSAYYEYLQREIGDTEHVVGLVKSAFATKDVSA